MHIQPRINSRIIITSFELLNLQSICPVPSVQLSMNILIYRICPKETETHIICEYDAEITSPEGRTQAYGV
jgi:hypothetical protein